MSIVTVKAALIAALQAIQNIGMVDGREGRVEGLPWQDMTTDAVRPLWTVKCTRDETVREFLGGSQRLRGYTFQIKGYFPHSFDADSDGTWDAYLDAVIDALAPEPALEVCTLTRAPVLRQNDFVMYGAGAGSVLCHYALLEFTAQELESLT